MGRLDSVVTGRLNLLDAGETLSAKDIKMRNCACLTVAHCPTGRSTKYLKQVTIAGEILHPGAGGHRKH